MKIFKIAALSSALAVTIPAFAQDVFTLDPGLYAINISATSGGMPIAQESMSECLPKGENTVTYAEAEQIISEDFECSYDNVFKSEGKITSDATCKMTAMDAILTGKAQVNYTGESMNLVFDGDMAVAGQNLPFNFQADAFKTSEICN